MCSVFRWVIMIELVKSSGLLAQIPPAEAWTAGNIVGVVVLTALLVSGLVVGYLRLR